MRVCAAVRWWCGGSWGFAVGGRSGEGEGGLWMDDLRIEDLVEEDIPVPVLNFAISTNGQQFTANPLTFNLYEQPQVSYLLPRAGTVLGGTLVSVYGRNFHSVATEVSQGQHSHSHHPAITSVLLGSMQVWRCTCVGYSGGQT